MPHHSLRVEKNLTPKSERNGSNSTTKDPNDEDHPLVSKQHQNQDDHAIDKEMTKTTISRSHKLIIKDNIHHLLRIL